MPKPMRFFMAVVLLLAAGMLAWALLIRPAPASVPPPPEDEISTFAHSNARGARGGAQGRSSRADSKSPSSAAASPAGGATGATGASSLPASSSTSAGSSGDTRSGGAAPGAPTEAVTVGPTYDASNTDVTPPVLLSPIVPKPLAQPRPNAPEGFARILVNERGAVESVRATVDPKTMSEAIIITNALSQAKTWSFQPAMKDGKAVRYLLMIPLSRF